MPISSISPTVETPFHSRRAPKESSNDKSSQQRKEISGAKRYESGMWKAAKFLTAALAVNSLIKPFANASDSARGPSSRNLLSDSSGLRSVNWKQGVTSNFQPLNTRFDSLHTSPTSSNIGVNHHDSSLQLFRPDPSGKGLSNFANLAIERGSIESVDVDADLVALLSSENSLSIYDANGDGQPRPIVDAIDIGPFLNGNSGSIKQVALDGDKIAVSVIFDAGQVGILFLELDRSGDGDRAELKRTHGALVGSTVGRIPIDLALNGNTAILTLDNDTLVANRYVASEDNSYRLSKDSACLGSCVDTLSKGNRIYQVSEGAVRILDLPTSDADFKAAATESDGYLDLSGYTSVIDGAKIIDTVLLGENELLLLKENDKLIILDVTDASSPTIASTITLNSLKEDGYTQVGLLQNSGQLLGVMTGEGNSERGVGPHLYAFPPKEAASGSNNIDALKPSEETAPVDLAPYFEAKEATSRGKAPIAAALTTGVVLGGGLETMGKMATMAHATARDGFPQWGDLGNLISSSADLGTFQPAFDGPVTSSFIKHTNPVVGTAVGILGAVRIGTILNSASELEKSIDNLMETLGRTYDFTVGEDSPLLKLLTGPVNGSVGSPSLASTSTQLTRWSSSLLDAARSGNYTADEVMQETGINTLIDTVQERVLDTIGISDAIDNTDILLDINLGSGLIDTFTNTFTNAISGLLETEYDGKHSGNYLEESIAATINSVIRQASTSRAGERVVADVLFAGLKDNLHDSIDFLIRNKDSVNEVASEYKAAFESIDKALIPLLKADIESAVKTKDSALSLVDSLVKPELMGTATLALGLIGRGISGTLLPHLHTATALFAHAIGRTGQPLTGRTGYDAAVLLPALASGWKVANMIRTREAHVADLLHNSGELVQNLGHSIDVALETLNDLAEPTKKAIELIRDTANESISLESYLNRTETLVAEPDFPFESSTVQINPLGIGGNLGYVAGQLTNYYADQHKEDITSIMKGIADNVKKSIAEPLQSDVLKALEHPLAQLEVARSAYSVLLNQLSDNVIDTGEKLDSMGDQFDELKYQFYADLPGGFFAGMVLALYVAHAVKSLAQGVTGRGGENNEGNGVAQENSAANSTANGRGVRDDVEEGVEMGRLDRS